MYSITNFARTQEGILTSQVDYVNELGVDERVLKVCSRLINDESGWTPNF
jgi:hypothetical protein